MEGRTRRRQAGGVEAGPGVPQAHVNFRSRLHRCLKSPARGGLLRTGLIYEHYQLGGISLLPRFAVSGALTSGTLARLDLTVRELSLRLIWHSAREGLPGLRDILYAAAGAAPTGILNPVPASPG